MDNMVDITVTQGDRRPMNIIDRDVVFTMWDYNSGVTYFRSRAMPVTPESGALRLIVPAAATAALSAGLYNLSATIVDSDGYETLLTWDQDHRGSLDVELNNDIMPPSRVTDIIDTWTLSDNAYVSSAVEGTITGSRHKGLFSVAVYSTNYSGTLRIQGTLDLTMNGMNTLWADLRDLEGNTALVLDDASGITALTFRSNMRWLRVTRVDDSSNTGTLDKVLIRV